MGASAVAMALVMLSESGLNPQAHNPNGDASGINQFMPSTLEGVATGLSPEEYRSLPASRQLDYVLKFWNELYDAHPGARNGGARDLYWLNFLPATYVANAPDSHVITSTDYIVAANPALADGNVIMAGGLKRALDRAAANNPHDWQAVLLNLKAVGGIPFSAPIWVDGFFAFATTFAVGLAAWYYFDRKEFRS